MVALGNVLLNSWPIVGTQQILVVLWQPQYDRQLKSVWPENRLSMGRGRVDDSTRPLPRVRRSASPHYFTTSKYPSAVVIAGSITLTL
jgi:hypothetical protein